MFIVALLPFLAAAAAQETITVCVPEFDIVEDKEICAGLGVTATQQAGTFTSCYWQESDVEMGQSEAAAACAAKDAGLLQLYSRDVGALMESKMDPADKLWLGVKKVGEEWKLLAGAEATGPASQLPHGVGTPPAGAVAGECAYFAGGVMVPAMCEGTDAPKALAICQKDVPRAQFKVVKGKQLIAPNVEGVVVGSAWYCGLQCVQTQGCVAISYDSGSKNCLLFDKKEMDFPDVYEAIPAATGMGSTAASTIVVMNRVM